MSSARTIFVALSIYLLAGFAVAETPATQPETQPAKDSSANVSIAELPVDPTIEVSPRYVCSRPGKPIAIDGDLSDWADVPTISLNTKEQSGGVSGEWEDPQDASGTMQMGWCSD